MDRPGSGWLTSVKVFPSLRNVVRSSSSQACQYALDGFLLAVEEGVRDNLVCRVAVADFLEFVSGVRRRRDALVVSPDFVVVLCLAERDRNAFFALGSFWVPMTVLSLDS